jgi:peroxiredoxin Q/BCP
MFVIKLAKRQTYLIDPDGRIAKVYMKVDPAEHAEELLADIRRLATR